jgi:hypothetical protein
VIFTPHGPPQADRPLSRSSRPVVAPDVVFAEVDGDTVLLDGRSGVYYALNQVGTRVWALVTGGAALGEIHDVLLAEYDVPVDVLWADLTRLVAEMEHNALVTIEASG